MTEMTAAVENGVYAKYEMSYVSNPLENGSKVKTIPEIISHWSDTKPTENAFVFLSTNGGRETVTWRGLYETSVEYAKAFINLGVKEREVVGISIPNCPKWLYVAFGAIFARAVPIGVHFKYKDGSDIVDLLRKIETCSAFVLDTDCTATIWPVFKTLLSSYSRDGKARSELIPSLRYVLSSSAAKDQSGIFTIGELLRSNRTYTLLPPIEPEDIAVLFQTSGSTGLSKIVSITHKLFATLAREKCLKDLLNPTDIIYNDGVFKGSGGDPFLLCSLLGRTRVLRSTLSEEPTDLAAFVIDAIKKEGCTILMAYPHDLSAIMDAFDKTQAAEETVLIHSIFTGGYPVNSKLARRLCKMCNVLTIGYGSTEVRNALIKSVRSADEFHQYDCGTVQEGLEVKIVNETGAVVQVGSRGELYVRGPVVFTGYFNDPEKTRNAFTEDGWFKTDDVGFMTEDGRFFVEGRKSDMILYGHWLCNPVDMESVLRNVTGLYDVAIVPISDDTLFQVLCACVIPDKDENIDEDAIRKAYEALIIDIPGMWVLKPTYYLLFDSFPKTPLSGKTQRKKLANIALQRIRPK